MVEERMRITPIHMNLQPKPFYQEKGKNKNTGKKHFGHLKEEVGTIISITSEDNHV